ncbi:MAG: class I SAM-dependent methyltransferase [Phenylobacterium sp.]
MDVAEFDQVAEEYENLHADNIKMSGEDPEYFARYKIEEVRRRWRGSGRRDPRAILDFGTGIGNSIPHLAEIFPQAALTALDVSQKSLDVAQRRFPGQADYVLYDGVKAPFEDQSFDLIFSACVFHHIDGAEHRAIFAELRRLLRPGGAMIIFEHNPLNPATRHMVATCPFDVNAVLIPAKWLRRSQREAGFGDVKVAYTAFFPGPLRGLRGLERQLTSCPLGAQYYTIANG